MTVSLLQKRIEFTRDLGELIQRAGELRYDMILCEAMRSREQARWNATHCRVRVDGQRCEQAKDTHYARHAFRPIGSISSLHVNGLAADFLIMEDGAILNDVAQYERLGDFWKDLRAGNRWGGDFQGFLDLGHFSREHEGKK